MCKNILQFVFTSGNQFLEETISSLEEFPKTCKISIRKENANLKITAPFLDLKVLNEI